HRHGLAPTGNPPPAEPIPYFPFQTARNMVLVSLLLGGIGVCAWTHGAPLEAPADSALQFTPRPEWYFRWLYELRRFFSSDWEFIATVVLPGVLGGFLAILPFLDQKLSPSRARQMRIALVILAVVTWGTF